MNSPTYSAHPEKEKGLFFTFVAVGLGFLLFAAIVFMVLQMSGKLENYDETRAQDRAKKLSELRAKEAKELHEYGWVDEKAGIARIPIERAMELELVVLKNKPIKAAGAIQPADLLLAPALTPPAAKP